MTTPDKAPSVTLTDAGDLRLAHLESLPDPNATIRALMALVAELGGKLAPKPVQLLCDDCGERFPVADDYVPLGVGAIPLYRDIAAVQGWTHPEDGLDYCPDCSEDEA